MNIERWNRIAVGLLLLGLAAAFSVAAAQTAAQTPAQAAAQEARSRRGTVQSELDYLKTAKVPISIELTQVTIREAYAGIAGKAGLSIAYEGAVNGGTKHDVSFKNKTVKEVLDKLGTKYGLTYRVDAPNKLTVIGSATS